MATAVRVDGMDGGGRRAPQQEGHWSFHVYDDYVEQATVDYCVLEYVARGYQEILSAAFKVQKNRGGTFVVGAPRRSQTSFVQRIVSVHCCSRGGCRSIITCLSCPFLLFFLLLSQPPAQIVLPLLERNAILVEPIKIRSSGTFLDEHITTRNQRIIQ